MNKVMCELRLLSFIVVQVTHHRKLLKQHNVHVIPKGSGVNSYNIRIVQLLTYMCTLYDAYCIPEKFISAVPPFSVINSSSATYVRHQIWSSLV